MVGVYGVNEAGVTDTLCCVVWCLDTTTKNSSTFHIETKSSELYFAALANISVDMEKVIELCGDGGIQRPSQEICNQGCGVENSFQACNLGVGITESGSH